MNSSVTLPLARRLRSFRRPRAELSSRRVPSFPTHTGVTCISPLALSVLSEAVTGSLRSCLYWGGRSLSAPAFSSFTVNAFSLPGVMTAPIVAPMVSPPLMGYAVLLDARSRGLLCFACRVVQLDRDVARILDEHLVQAQRWHGPLSKRDLL